MRLAAEVVTGSISFRKELAAGMPRVGAGTPVFCQETAALLRTASSTGRASAA